MQGCLKTAMNDQALNQGRSVIGNCLQNNLCYCRTAVTFSKMLTCPEVLPKAKLSIYIIKHHVASLVEVLFLPS